MGPSKLLKIITLTVQATENHTHVKVNNILKWLKSGHDVKVTITGLSDRQKQMDSICQMIEREARPGSKLLQKVVKTGSIKFLLKANENASNLVIKDVIPNPRNIHEEELETISAGKDILSEEFERELDSSIEEEKNRSKKR